MWQFLGWSRRKNWWILLIFDFRGDIWRLGSCIQSTVSLIEKGWFHSKKYTRTGPSSWLCENGSPKIRTLWISNRSVSTEPWLFEEEYEGSAQKLKKNSEENLQLISKFKWTILISQFPFWKYFAWNFARVMRFSLPRINRALHTWIISSTLATRLSMAGDIHQRISIDHPSTIYETF